MGLVMTSDLWALVEESNMSVGLSDLLPLRCS